MNKVLTSTQKIVEEANDVKMNLQKIKEFGEKINENDLKDESHSMFNFIWHKELKLQIVFFFNVMNFCYWAPKDKPKWTITIEGEELDGSVALLKLLERALKNNEKFLSNEYINKLTFEDFKEFIKGSPEIPLIETRFKFFKESSNKLNEEFGDSVMNLIQSCNFDSIKILETLESFDAFKDSARYKGQEIFFLKRAQLLVKDFYDVLDKKFSNIEYLTAFADYKVPQILEHFGILEYSKNLREKLDNYEIIEKDSKLELEIRASQIWAIEYLKDELNKKNKNITSSEIDVLLWMATQNMKEKMKPYHRTVTEAY